MVTVSSTREVAEYVENVLSNRRSQSHYLLCCPLRSLRMVKHIPIPLLFRPAAQTHYRDALVALSAWDQASPNAASHLRHSSTATVWAPRDLIPYLPLVRAHMGFVAHARCPCATLRPDTKVSVSVLCPHERETAIKQAPKMAQAKILVHNGTSATSYYLGTVGTRHPRPQSSAFWAGSADSVCAQ